MNTATRLAEIGARGSARREELGMQKNELAVVLDLSTNRINQMERDGVTNLRLIYEWAEALDMDPVVLAFGEMSVCASANMIRHTTAFSKKKGRES